MRKHRLFFRDRFRAVFIEIWRSIRGYAGIYEVSSAGRVRSIRSGRYKGIILRQSLSNGYLKVDLKRSKKKCGRARWTAKIHWLVAVAFLHPHRVSSPVVNHRDNNRKNNWVGNLENTSQSENLLQYHREQKFSPVEIVPDLSEIMPELF